MSLTKTFQNRIENEIEEMFSTSADPQNLYNPAKYVMSLGGKRLRPVLCLTGCDLFDSNAVENAVYPAIGLEVFHNFTLLHDDLMDKSDMRRNQPTVHKKWNENIAILSGDAMMVMAYRLISKAPVNALSSVLETFGQTAIEVCEGQQYDMDFETRENVTENEYIEMIRLKTSVLLGGSIKIGAIIGGASNEESKKLYDFGCDAGISFQIKDDWLDVFGNSADFGKPIGGDIICNKKTFLLITALNDLPENSKKELKKWLDKKEFDRDEKISAVKNFYEEAKVSKKAQEKMNFYYGKSLKRLNEVEGPKEVLSELGEFAVNMIVRTR